MTVIKEFFIALGIDADDAVEDLDAVDEASDKAATGLTAKLGKATDLAGKGLAAVSAAAVASGLALFGLAKHAAETGAAIDDGAKRAGASAREYQRLTFALEAGGAGPEVLAEALKTLSVGMAAAEKGAGPAAEALARLGLTAAELEGMGTEDRLAAIADGLRGVEGEGARAATLVGLFGGAASKLRPILEEGGSAIRAYGDDAERLGLVLEDDVIAKAAALDDQLGILGRQFDAVLVDVGSEIVPVVADIASELGEFIANNRELIAQNLAEFFEELVPLVKASAEIVFELVGATGELVDGAGGAENALKLVAGGLTAIKLAGMGIPGAMAAASLSIGLLASEAISELNGVNAELRRTESLLRAGKAALAQGAAGEEAIGDLDKLSYRDLAKLSDREFQRRVDVAERGINAAYSATGRDGTSEVFRLREVLAERRALGRRILDSDEAIDAGFRVQDLVAKANAGVLKAAKGGAKRGGGGGKGRIDLGEVNASGLAEILRNAGDNTGATGIAVDKAIDAAAAALAEGAAFDVARTRGIGVLEGLTGRKVSAGSGTLDPILAGILGTDVSGASARASIASTGLTPQTLINTTNNSFNFDVEIHVDGAGDPAAVAEGIGPSIRRAFDADIAKTAREIEVTIKR